MSNKYPLTHYGQATKIFFRESGLWPSDTLGRSADLEGHQKESLVAIQPLDLPDQVRTDTRRGIETNELFST
jgi:hypothetical protein